MCVLFRSLESHAADGRNPTKRNKGEEEVRGRERERQETDRLRAIHVCVNSGKRGVVRVRAVVEGDIAPEAVVVVTDPIVHRCYITECVCSLLRTLACNFYCLVRVVANIEGASVYVCSLSPQQQHRSCSKFEIAGFHAFQTITHAQGRAQAQIVHCGLYGMAQIAAVLM